MISSDRDLILAIVNATLPKDDGSIIDEAVINQAIDFASKTPMLKSEITDEDKEKIRRIIHETHSIRLGRGVAIVGRDHKKWFLQKKPSLEFDYWNRFKKYLENDKHFAPKVVAGMDQDSDEIVDLLGNPNTNHEMQRRGLIIGDVQSGKTANYSGVICKAVDAGYRVVILLTGTSNDLRRQTQVRLDEAFLGFDSAAFAKKNGLKFIGAGIYNDKLNPIAVTNVDNDFRKSVTQVSMGLSNSKDSRPMLFVCKKNVTVLRSLYDWIISYNKHGDSKIDNTVLMIDDEADYASINTRTNNDPTATNKCIRDILNAFRFASYVGFTATPYANIFIDPQSNEEMKDEDLFPADYIYTLEAPSNYIGARNIFGPSPNHDNMLREIDDAEDYYPFKHKKDANFRFISPSLKKAINTFLVANVLRDLDGDEDSYRSMMINVTRFNNTQNQLHETIQKYITQCQNSIKANSHLDVNEALDDECILGLHEAFEEEFSDTDYSWKQVQANLEKSIVINPVLVFCANQGNKDLDYSKYSEKIRAIVIGGQALSRGLTLEGLMVSYIYRRSMAYDTLMQMGRWFGYRDHYSQYCRIYMDPESIAWYATISDATDELRNEVKRMRERNATPMEFGLKVREDPEMPLIVTARNKMRSAQNRMFTTSLSEVMIETQSLCKDDASNTINLNVVRNLFDQSSLERINDGKKNALLNVPRETVVKLLNNIKVSELNNRFDQKTMADFIKQYRGDELDKWDIVIASGSGENYHISDNLSTHLTERQASLVRDDKYILLNKNRLGSPTDMSFGLSEEQKYIATHEADGTKKKHPSAVDFLRKEVGKRNALLIVYLVNPVNSQKEKLVESAEPAVGFSIGIPYLKDQDTRYLKYQVNKIYQMYGDVFDDEDESDNTNEEDLAW